MSTPYNELGPVKTFAAGSSNYTQSSIDSTVWIDRCNPNGWAMSSVQITESTPSTAAIFGQGGTIFLFSTSSLYLNTATDGITPTWVPIDTGTEFSLPAVLNDTTTTSGVSFQINEEALTTGIALFEHASQLTTGTIYRASAPTSSVTTGKYYEAYDGQTSTSLWSIGEAGHMYSHQATAPTIVVGTANGITAAAITAGSTDMCGNITTNGTNDNAGATVLNITFNKAYATAPKVVMLTGTSTSAVDQWSPIISAKSTTGFSITILQGGSATANPSFSYFVIG